MLTEKIHAVTVRWPAVEGDIADREAALRERDVLRRGIEEAAYSAGATQVRILGAWGVVIDHYPLDTRRFTVREGQRVSFPSKSAGANGARRFGTVVAETATRVRIAYVFKHGGASEKWVTRRDVRPARG